MPPENTQRSQRHVVDRPVFDVSLVAGHRDRFGSRSDFSASFVGGLGKYAREARRIVQALRPTAAGRLHFTLRGVYADRSPMFPRQTRLWDRRRRYEQVAAAIASVGTGKVHWQEYVLTMHGVLILKGQAIGPWLSTLRRQIDRDSDQRVSFPANSFCHIVLARPSRRLTVVERKKLNAWIGDHQMFRPRQMTIQAPALIVTRNHFGTLYHAAHDIETSTATRGRHWRR